MEKRINKKSVVLKKLVCLFVVFCMVLPMMPVYAAAELPAEFHTYEPVIGDRVAFNPPHKYACHQNPPDFTWPDFGSATSWEIVVASDSELKDVRYTVKGVKNNYYNFKETFEPGTYWWAVRATVGNETTGWSVARRFRIDEDYDVFIPPTSEEIMAQIPQNHPRILFTQDTWESFVAEKTSTEAGKDYWKNLAKLSEGYVNNSFVTLDEYLKTSPSSMYIRNQTTNWGKEACIAALAYWYTGDERYADYAVARLLEMAKWEWDSADDVTAYAYNDQTFWWLLFRYGVAYDWMYNYMSQEERATVGDVLHDRFMSRAEADFNTLYNMYLDSHMRDHSSNYIICATSLLYDYEDVQEYFTKMVDMAIPTDTPYCVEDGSYSKGWYWMFEFGSTYSKSYFDFWEELGIVDYFTRTDIKNSWLYAMYMFPENSWGNFGDGAMQSRVSANYDTEFGLGRQALKTNNPYAKWEYDRRGGIADIPKNEIGQYLYAYNEDTEGKAPYSFQRSRAFFDTGMTAMHSDLIDQNRISLYFNSGQYGSYNHLRPDVNGFIIEAWGDRLAAHGGHYDYYNSDHYRGFTGKTYAANTITVDGGIGQPMYNIEAKGNTDMFATSAEFDAVVGDASNSYAGAIDKFVRSIVYVRPDTYIIIDDLAASSKKADGSVFEWWLNTFDDEIKLHEDGKGATIFGEINGNLDARIQYPENVTPYYSNLFSGPDLVSVPPGGGTSQVHERIWFETEKLKDTKMISTINVHSNTDSGAYVKTTTGENYMKLEFENGIVAYVSTTTDANAVIKADHVEFVGTAAVLSEDSVMLVGGTSLKIGGKKIFESDRAVTVTSGHNEINVSSNEDFNVSVYAGNEFAKTIESIKDRDGNELSPLKGAVLISDEKMAEALQTTNSNVFMSNGVGDVSESYTLSKNAEKINIKADKGCYSFMLNGQVLPGEKTGNKLSFDLIVDGVKTTYEGEAILDVDYSEVAYIEGVKLDRHKYYVVDKSEHATLLDTFIEKGKEDARLDGTYTVKIKKNGDFIELRNNDPIIPTATLYEDVATMKAKATIFKEAEQTKDIWGTCNTSDAAFDYLSGRVGISKLNTENDGATYEIYVNEAGTYDLMICLASWMSPNPTREIEIGGNKYGLECLYTGGWGGNGASDFDVVYYDANIHLEPGVHTFTIRGTTKDPGQQWNYDWIGFVKE